MALQFSAKLKEALETLAGDRGNSLDHAIRRRELEPYLNVIGKAQLRLNAVLGQIKTVQSTADAAFAKHDETVAAAQAAVDQLNQDILDSFGSFVPIDGRNLIEQLEHSFGPLDTEFSLEGKINATLSELHVNLPRLYDLEAARDDVWQRLMGLAGVQAQTDQRIADAGIYTDPDDGKVRIYALEATRERVSNVEVNLDAVEATLSLKASVAYVDEQIAYALTDPSQFPLLDGAFTRISDVELLLDAEGGRIDSIAATLTVDGEYVTMSTVTQTLDSLAGEIALKASQIALDDLEERTTAAELVISAVEDAATIRQSVEASRRISSDMDDLTSGTIGELWARWKADEEAREALAQAETSINSTVDEKLGAVSSQVTELRVEYETGIAQVRSAQTATSDGLSATAEDVTQLQADMETVQGDVAGQAAALEQTIARVEVNEKGLLAVEATNTTILLSSVREQELDTEDFGERNLVDVWNEWNREQAGRAEVAIGFAQMATRVEEGLLAEAQQRSLLGAALEGARATVIEERTARVTADDALAREITTLQATLEGEIAGQANAMEFLAARVSTTEGGIVSVSQAVTALENKVNDEATGTTANANAVNSLGSRVTVTENTITSHGEQLTTLNTDLTTLDGEGKANAQAITGLTALTKQNGDDISAQAGRIVTLETEINTPTTGVKARLSTVEATKVTSAGAIAAVTQTISASYGTLAALAEATAFAKAGVDGISSGYVWRLNGQGVFELVSVQQGTTGPVVTGKIKTDYLQITGLTQIDQAVINSLTANTGFIDNLSSRAAFIQKLVSDQAFLDNVEIGRAQIKDVIQSDNFVAGTTGMRLNFATGKAEFNNIETVRQIEVASGTLSVATFGMSQDKNTFGPGPEILIHRVGIDMTAWAGAKRTYVAAAGMSGVVTIRDDGSDGKNKAKWGWKAEVLPLTSWFGPQELSLLLTFYGQNIQQVSNCTVTWKIYEVN